MVCINKPLPDISFTMPYSNRCSGRISSPQLLSLEDLCRDNLKILLQDTIPLKSNSNGQSYRELFADYIVGGVLAISALGILYGAFRIFE